MLILNITVTLHEVMTQCTNHKSYYLEVHFLIFFSFQLDVEIIVNNLLLLTSVNYMHAVLDQMKCKIKSYIQSLVCIIYQYSNKLTQIIKKINFQVKQTTSYFSF